MAKTNNEVIGLIQTLSSHTDSRNLKAAYFAAKNIHACRQALAPFSEVAKPHQTKMMELEAGPLALRAAAKAELQAVAIAAEELKPVDKHALDAIDEQYATEIAEHAAAVSAINELLALDCEVSAYTCPGQSLPDGVFSTADLVVFLEHGLID